MYVHAAACDMVGMRLGYAYLIEVFRCETYFVRPIYGEWVQREIAEIGLILKFCANALLCQWPKVHRLDCSIVERQTEHVIVKILSINYFKNRIHKTSFLCLL